MYPPHSGPALVVTRPGGGEVLRVEDRAANLPDVGELLIEVSAAGVNLIDVYRLQGVYPTPTPFVAGNEGAGVVVDIGPEVEDVTVGDYVAWPMTLGSAARYTVVPAHIVVPLPNGVNLETAAAVILQGLTAHYLTTRACPVLAQ